MAYDMHRHHCRCCASDVALVALALLPSLHWHHHIVALALSPTLICWRCCSHCNGAIAVAQASLPLLCWCCLPRRAGIVAVVALALLPLLLSLLQSALNNWSIGWSISAHWVGLQTGLSLSGQVCGQQES
jgi:hypothetical protein